MFLFGVCHSKADRFGEQAWQTPRVLCGLCEALVVVFHSAGTVKVNEYWTTSVFCCSSNTLCNRICLTSPLFPCCLKLKSIMFSDNVGISVQLKHMLSLK